MDLKRLKHLILSQRHYEKALEQYEAASTALGHPPPYKPRIFCIVVKEPLLPTKSYIVSYEEGIWSSKEADGVFEYTPETGEFTHEPTKSD